MASEVFDLEESYHSTQSPAGWRQVVDDGAPANSFWNAAGSAGSA